MTSVLIVGGYGAVGRHAAAALLERRPEVHVRVGGRRPLQAVPVPGAVAVRVDTTDSATIHGAMEGVTAVLNCTEDGNVDVARIALERGVDYADVSATPQVVADIAGLDGLARSCGARAVVSVGLVPGISNLLAALVAQGGERQVAVGILLGAGEHHGRAALDWTLRGLGQMRGSWSVPFPPPYGPRTVHAFPFSDQFTLPETIGVESVRTGLCLDSRAATQVLRALSRPVAGRLLRRRAVREMVLTALAHVHLGDDGFALAASSSGVHAGVTGREQSRATGIIAALVLDQIHTFAPGVHHLEQVVRPEAFLADAAASAGLDVHRTR
ncbi:NAD(P)H-binding protein [Actinotalea sp. AC32]|nr:NAD(P)H-binding protein [Actinotalea sp. AC32]